MAKKTHIEQPNFVKWYDKFIIKHSYIFTSREIAWQAYIAGYEKGRDSGKAKSNLLLEVK